MTKIWHNLTLDFGLEEAAFEGKAGSSADVELIPRCVEKTSEKGELLADDVVTGADLEDFRLLLAEVDAGCADMEPDNVTFRCSSRLDESGLRAVVDSLLPKAWQCIESRREDLKTQKGIPVYEFSIRQEKGGNGNGRSEAKRDDGSLF